MADSNRIRTKTITVTVPNGAATAVGIPNLINGIVKGMAITAPVLTSANYAVSILGPVAGWTLFNKATLTPNAVSVIPADNSAGNMAGNGIPVDPNSTVTITTASNEGAQRVFTVTLFIER